MKWCIYALDCMSDVFDAAFNPDDKPHFNIGPTPGMSSAAVNWFSGMSPESIKDGKARAEYEKALADNKNKSENYIFQSKLRKLLRRITENMLEATAYRMALQDGKDGPPQEVLEMIRQR